MTPTAQTTTLASTYLPAELLIIVFIILIDIIVPDSTVIIFVVESVDHRARIGLFVFLTHTHTHTQRATSKDITTAGVLFCTEDSISASILSAYLWSLTIFHYGLVGG